MGREALCSCQFGDITGNVKALLEPPELILRGEIRRRIPIAQISNLRIEAGRLAFTYNDSPVALTLGPILARKWEVAIRKPPPTLAAKLGLTPSTRVRVLGTIDDSNLEAALQTVEETSSLTPDLILARIDNSEDLTHLLRHTQGRIPLWAIYPKGPGLLITETLIRSTLRDAGMIDTKVASVSPRLTALRFNPRKPLSSLTTLAPMPQNPLKSWTENFSTGSSD